MRKLWTRRLAAGLLQLALASGASAGPISGTLTLILGGLQPITINVSGSGSSSTGGVSIAPGLFSIQTAAPGTMPFITEVRITATNAAGSFSGATLQGAMAVAGRLRLMQNGLTAFSIPLTVGGTRGVGLGGAAISSAASPSSFIALTGGQWSAGVVQVMSAGTGPGLRTVSLTGSDARTPNGAGTITLVTPMRLTHSLLSALPAFAVLQLTFAPEPGAAALLLAAAAFAAFGISRPRRA